MRDIKIWEFIKSHLEKDEAVILMLVVDSENSSPGRAGFKMAVSKNKEMIGSIGGGMMEFNLVDEAVANLASNKIILSLKFNLIIYWFSWLNKEQVICICP